MKLSIITINLNNKTGLQKTIDSIIAQTYKDFEWIIIDGGSTDGSVELIKEISQHLNYWVSEPDNGIYNAMNKGVRVVHGEYFLFLNSGDYLYDNNVLMKVIPLLREMDFYVGNELQDDIVVRSNISTLEKMFYTLTTASLPHQSTFINRRVFLKYGLYREDLRACSDWYMFYKAIIMGNATVENLNFIISVFDTNGISQNELSDSERNMLFLEMPNINCAIRFYYQNYNIVYALKEYKLTFFLFRVYYYFYRIWKNIKYNKQLCQKYR